MRDVVTGFYLDVLRRLMEKGTISKSDSVLVVCGGPLDEKVIREIGFAKAVVTNLDGDMAAQTQDAENLAYTDNEFDVVIVHAGLHHCYSPHRALLEMYRVARKCAIAFESRDSFLMRSAVRLKLTLDYEVNSISPDGQHGGVADSGIPNFIYRWTEREVMKTISSYDPSHVTQVNFFYDFRLPIQRFTADGNAILRSISLLVEPLSKVFATIFPKQCNEFAFAVQKSRNVQPWIKPRPLPRQEEKQLKTS